MARELWALPPDLLVGDMALAARESLVWAQRLGEVAPKLLLAVLRRPQVHMWLTTARLALDARDLASARARIGRLHLQLGLELALEGAVPPRGLTFPRPLSGLPPTLASPSHRALVEVPAGAAQVAFGRREVRFGADPAIDLDALEPSPDYPPVAGRIVLGLRDDFPISDFEAHPDKEGNSLSLGAATRGDWLESLAGAMHVVARYLPALRHEMDLVLTQLIPVGTHDHDHLSASYREAIGTIYLTLHPMQMTMAEALVHEFQHNKVNMLFHVDPVMHNAFWPLYESPVRPDPRPLHGVLLAAHAFVPVAELYRRMLDADAPEPVARSSAFVRRYEAVVAKNRAALDTLAAHAEASARGRELLDELASLHATHEAHLSALPGRS